MTRQKYDWQIYTVFALAFWNSNPVTSGILTSKNILPIPVDGFSMTHSGILMLVLANGQDEKGRPAPTL